MRVIHVITRLIVGGAQENTIASVLGLRQKPGLDVSLISGPSHGPEGSLEPALAGFPRLLTIVPELVRPVHPWYDLLTFKKLTATFRNARPDIVHTHSGKAGILGRLAAAKARVPIIVHTIHGPSFGPFQGPAANSLFRSAERYAGRVTTAFVCVADAMRDQYLKASIGRADQYSTIRSGFDLKPFIEAGNGVQLRAQWGFAPGDIIVGKIARLFRLKGHDDLLAIAPALVKALPNLRFLLVGDGAWRGKLETKARLLGLRDHFVFTGLVRPSEVPPLVGAMNMLVHLSQREGLARALPQAFAAARPVIAYDCDGAFEVCRDNETGFLVRPGDLDTLKKRILQLASNPTLCQRLGGAGQRLVLECFTVERMVEDLRQLYLRLAAEQGIAPDNGAIITAA